MARRRPSATDVAVSTRAGAGSAARQMAARSVAGRARGASTATQITVARHERRRLGQGGRHAGRVLVRHRRGQQRDRARGQDTERRSSRDAARAAAPAGLWAPSSRTSRPSTSMSSSRPGHRTSAYPRRRASASTDAMPAAASASSRASATATLAAWWRPRRPTRVGPSVGQVHRQAVAIPVEQRRRSRLR